jgi:transcriptional regulator
LVGRMEIYQRCINQQPTQLNAMYTPRHFEPPSIEAMHALIRAFPLGALVTTDEEGLHGNHLPMELVLGSSAHGILRGHVSRANALWRSAGKEALIIFQGPDAYISPSWYPGKEETGKVVPTWNYTVVHINGMLKTIDDPRWLRKHLESLTAHQEQGMEFPWAVADAPEEYTEKLISSIVGIEIEISRMLGKWKVSQNRNQTDRAGVVRGLRNAMDVSGMADLVEQSGSI